MVKILGKEPEMYSVMTFTVFEIHFMTFTVTKNTKSLYLKVAIPETQFLSNNKKKGSLNDSLR